MASAPFDQFDPKAYKAQQREEWSNAAPGWRRRWPAFERAAQPLSDRMMELAHIAPGQRVLDIATGIGEPAMTAARRVGTNGSVTAVDQAPQMLAIARERMLAASVRNVEFVEGDAETVALPSDAFDAVVCRWGLFFLTDVVGTLTRLRASLVPGGWLAAVVWGVPEHVPVISLTFRALAGLSQQLGRPPTPPAGPNPFALAGPAKLEQVLRDAGFAEVHSEPFTVTFVFDSVDELLGHLGDVSATLRGVLATQSPEHQALIWEKLAESARAFAGPDGRVALPNACLLVSGQRQ